MDKNACFPEWKDSSRATLYKPWISQRCLPQLSREPDHYLAPKMVESTLQVNGASLYYKTIGTGPLLVIIPVGNGTGLFYEPLASHLSSHFRVLLYDRRGYYRSPADKTPATDEVFQIHADDAAALIEHVYSSSRNGGAPEPAFILSPSVSVGIGIELLTTRPHLVNKLVLHEPVLASIVPDPIGAQFLSSTGRVLRKALEGDIIGASAMMFPQVHTKAEVDAYRKTSVCRQLAARISPQEQGRWLVTELAAAREFKPDVEKLQRSPYREKLILICGTDHAPSLSRIPGLCLGAILRMSIGIVPGGHIGYITHAREFAECLGNLFVARDGARL